MEEEDNGANSDDEECLEASAPSRRPIELDCEECTLSIDEMAKQRVQDRRVGLERGLGEEELVPGLFFRFFPM